MLTIHLLLVILSLVCFFCAAIGIPSSRINLIAAGLFLWVLAAVIAS